MPFKSWLPLTFAKGSNELMAPYTDICKNVCISITFYRFPVRSSGIRQGYVISPNMFNLHVIDLAAEIKQINLGVNISNETADKLALLKFSGDMNTFG